MHFPPPLQEKVFPRNTWSAGICVSAEHPRSHNMQRRNRAPRPGPGRPPAAGQLQRRRSKGRGGARVGSQQVLVDGGVWAKRRGCLNQLEKEIKNLIWACQWSARPRERTEGRVGRGAGQTACSLLVLKRGPGPALKESRSWLGGPRQWVSLQHSQGILSVQFFLNFFFTSAD